MNNELLLFCLDWLSANTPSLVQLFTALVPVMALGVAGYALYVTSKKGGRK
ncbi:hypothetical protein [Burkholderia pyrrocinia]|uniref:hypothetical protein n=1 Tax=Burkholderia pyrrocinia TaxID=60550 RepID=UPI001BCC607E|nr:hypothetical protein [Burkholderia pyrrocinia]QVN17102.1 hypothetical protein JYG32_12535 [Burkholderia pyrrocinia]